MISAGEGNGPVNALDVALRKDLGKYQKYISRTGTHRLSCAYPRWRHRRGDAGADRNPDETGDRWTTIGVSPNIIEASFQALMDSIVFKLHKEGAPG